MNEDPPLLISACSLAIRAASSGFLAASRHTSSPSNFIQQRMPMQEQPRPTSSPYTMARPISPPVRFSAISALAPEKRAAVTKANQNMFAVRQKGQKNAKQKILNS